MLINAYHPKILRRYSKAVLLALTASMLACTTPAPQPMPLSKAAPILPKDEGSLILMTATIKNDLAPDYQPEALFVRLRQAQAAGRPKLLRFSVLPTDQSAKGSRLTGNTYLLRFQLEPGTYRLLGINVSAGEFPLRGFGFLPIHADFTVPVGGNYYLGNVRGVVRQRRANEYRVGPVTPQVDQSVTGFAQGTFDVLVQDLFEQDLSLNQSRFPAIEDRQIDKALLSPIDRRRAQIYWEEQ